MRSPRCAPPRSHAPSGEGSIRRSRPPGPTSASQARRCFARPSPTPRAWSVGTRSWPRFRSRASASGRAHRSSRPPRTGSLPCWSSGPGADSKASVNLGVRRFRSWPPARILCADARPGAGKGLCAIPDTAGSRFEATSAQASPMARMAARPLPRFARRPLRWKLPASPCPDGPEPEGSGGPDTGWLSHTGCGGALWDSS